MVCEAGHAWVEVRRDFEEPRTLVYVIDTLAIPRADADGRVPGFDLDGIDSAEGSEDPMATCSERHADYQSSVDPNLSGVDNQLQTLLPTIEGLLDPARCPGESTTGCFDALTQQQLDEGAIVRLIELSGIDSFENDDHVVVTIHEGRLPARTGPALGPDGRVAPGQRFEVDPMGMRSSGPGTILAGRVAFGPGFIYFPLDADVLRLSLPIREARLRFDIEEGRLVHGVIGGVVLNEPVTSHPDPSGTLCGVLADVVDMSLGGEACCVEPGACCNGVSVGLTFTGTRAEL